MNRNFIESFNEYLLSRIQDGIDQHKANNPSYQRMKQKHENLYELADEMIEELPDGDREMMVHDFDMDAIMKTEEGIMIYH